MLKAELLGWVVESLFRLIQDKQEFSFEFCNFAIRCIGWPVLSSISNYTKKKQ